PAAARVGPDHHGLPHAFSRSGPLFPLSHLRGMTTTTPSRPRLLDQVRQALRVRHYSARTQKPYIRWIRRFVLFHGTRHPAAVGGMTTPAPARRRLRDQVREALRVRHYSARTEKAYSRWIRRFVLLHGTRHPADLGGAEVTAFLSWLAEERKVSPSSQTQGLCALLFLYRHVLRLDLPWMTEVARAPARTRLPIVLSRDEVRAVIRRLEGVERL